MKAFAYLNGADEVQSEHLEVAQHSLWDDPHEQLAKVTQVIAKIANPTGMRVTQLLLEVESVLAATDVRNLAEAAIPVYMAWSAVKGNGPIRPVGSDPPWVRNQSTDSVGRGPSPAIIRARALRSSRSVTIGVAFSAGFHVAMSVHGNANRPSKLGLAVMTTRMYCRSPMSRYH